jgi:hypothetical protein
LPGRCVRSPGLARIPIARIPIPHTVHVQVAQPHPDQVAFPLSVPQRAQHGAEGVLAHAALPSPQLGPRCLLPGDRGAGIQCLCEMLAVHCAGQMGLRRVSHLVSERTLLPAGSASRADGAVGLPRARLGGLARIRVSDIGRRAGCGLRDWDACGPGCVQGTAPCLASGGEDGAELRGGKHQACGARVSRMSPVPEPRALQQGTHLTHGLVGPVVGSDPTVAGGIGRPAMLAGPRAVVKQRMGHHCALFPACKGFVFTTSLCCTMRLDVHRHPLTAPSAVPTSGAALTSNGTASQAWSCFLLRAAVDTTRRILGCAALGRFLRQFLRTVLI